MVAAKFVAFFPLWLFVMFGIPFLTILFFRGLRRAAHGDPVIRDGAMLLRYPVPMRVGLHLASALLLGLSVALAWPFVTGTANDADVLRAFTIVPFAALSALCFFRESRVALVVDGEGIRGRTAFRGRRNLAWRSVVDARYAAGGWVTLRDRRGEVLRVPMQLRGVHAAIAAARSKVRVDVCEGIAAATEVCG